MPQRSHSPARRASGRLARLSAQPGSVRSKRLSYARDELDQALQNAVGDFDLGMRCDAPGDMTTSKNEDFSMVSMESLQTAKETSMSNVMQTIPEGDKSAASVSYMPSSPPKVRYPRIERKAERARSSLGQSVANAYDPMSWRPTAPSNKPAPVPRETQQERRLRNERQWQEVRESVSQQIEQADNDDVLLVDDGQDDAEDDIGQEVAGDEEDLWQDEASRSIDEGHGKQSRRRAADEPERSPQVEDLFAGQPLKPLRSKIPRTWRRSSGMDFSYVDSPAHEPEHNQRSEFEEQPAEEGEATPDEESDEGPADEQVGEPAEAQNRHSTDGSGVLTPPSTEDSEQSNDDEEEEGEDDESEFEPEAEATRMQNAAQEDGGDVDEDADSDQSMSSPDGEDTGNFFQTNLPQVYPKDRPRRRPPRQKTMDLTELLNLDGANSPEKAAVTGSRAGAAGSPKAQGRTFLTQAKHSPPQRQGPGRSVQDREKQQGREKLLGSPLRKSLLRSSKMYGSPAGATRSRSTRSFFPIGNQRQQATDMRFEPIEDAEVGNSFESKASDQRQLLSEANIEEQRHEQYEYDDEDDNEDEDEGMTHNDQPQGSYQPYVQDEEVYDEEDDRDMTPEEDEYSEEEVAEPSRSYEERLNLDSPQKIKMNFNDSSKTASSLFVNKNNPRLFDPLTAPRHPPAAEQHSSYLDSSDTITLVGKKPVPGPPQPGFFSRLSTTFWNAVITPPQPTVMLPSHEECIELFRPALRTEIRNRYGVISEDFPWTFAQMRTLHRMLNSLTSKRIDSIIPTSGRLPYYLENIIETEQTDVAGKAFFFEYNHAYVVLSFFQVMVSRHLIEAMRRGEVEPLGDDWSQEITGLFKGIHGSEVVFKKELHGKKVTDWVDSHKGRVGMDFVVKALGTCVLSNIDFSRKWGMPFEELQRRGLVGTDPPPKKVVK